MNTRRLSCTLPQSRPLIQAYVTEFAYCCTANDTVSRGNGAVIRITPSPFRLSLAGILADVFGSHRRNILTSPVFIVLASVFLHAPFAGAWGNEGHRMINRLAASNLPQDAPAFLRSQDATREMETLGPEPDRWRSPGEAELN